LDMGQLDCKNRLIRRRNPFLGGVYHRKLCRLSGMQTPVQYST
jgi:hypothetical protein